MTAVNSVYCSWATWSSRPVLCMCVTWYHICFLVTSSGPLVTKRTCIEVQSHLAPLMCILSKYFSWWFQVSVASFKSYWIQRVYFVLYGPIRGGESRVHIWMSQTCDWLVATLQALQCLLQSWLVVLEQKKNSELPIAGLTNSKLDPDLPLTRCFLFLNTKTSVLETLCFRHHSGISLLSW